MAITIGAREGQIKDMITSALTKGGNVVHNVLLSWTTHESEDISIRASVCLSAKDNAGTTQLTLTKDGLEILLKGEFGSQGYNIATITWSTEDPPYWCAGCLGRGIVATATLVEPAPRQAQASRSKHVPKSDF